MNYYIYSGQPVSCYILYILYIISCLFGTYWQTSRNIPARFLRICFNTRRLPGSAWIRVFPVINRIGLDYFATSGHAGIARIWTNIKAFIYGDDRRLIIKVIPSLQYLLIINQKLSFSLSVSEKPLTQHHLWSNNYIRTLFRIFTGFTAWILHKRTSTYILGTGGMNAASASDRPHVGH